MVFENADIGIVLDGASFVTIQNVTFNSARPRSTAHPYYGGKGIWLKARARGRAHAFFLQHRTQRARMQSSPRLLTAFSQRLPNTSPQGTFDCLVRDFRFNARFRYEIVTSYFAVGNV